MKYYIIIALFAFGYFGSGIEAIGQTPSKNTSVKSSSMKRKPATTTKRTVKSSSSTASITPAIDSFKRSNRYSPGRPYEAAAGATPASTANNTNQATTINNNPNPANNTNAGVVNSSANPQLNTGVNVNSNVSAQRSVPESPSMERNRADVNQQQVNENSKNAISDMNSGQVNALNQNQMAPPPQNWGNNQPVDNKWSEGRNTIGESQWTPSATISSSFVRDFPNVSGATWIRDVRDTMNYSARYRTGDSWTTSTYNSGGVRIDSRTELPVTDLPRAVALYRDKQAANNIQFDRVTRVERPSMSEVYEVRLNSGKVVYINSQGVEVP